MFILQKLLVKKVHVLRKLKKKKNKLASFTKTINKEQNMII